MPHAPYRALPSVDRVLRTPEIEALLGRFSREVVVLLVRAVLQEARAGVGAGEASPTPQVLARAIEARASRVWVQAPTRVINATGVILHTNLGRAPLSSEAIAAMGHAASYSDLELNLVTGDRDTRQTHVRKLLTMLSGAESAYVTSNAAGAVLLALAALARGKEVIVSRGQAVEIGGGFRIPSVLRQSGARLVEVGTTNRTRISDYEDAITPRTAVILHVHPSNFRIVGFTESVPLRELADLARRRQLLFFDDNGSGAFLDTSPYGLAHEPTPQESLEAGVDLVAFSGDKLLGGPQAGIVLGRKEILERLASHPLARAIRPDKMTIAALGATLLAYLRGDAEVTLPIWRMIAAPSNVLEERVGGWIARAEEFGMAIEARAGESTVGGGSLPGETLATTLGVLPAGIKAEWLRRCTVPIIGRTVRDRVVLDPRTVLPGEDIELIEGLQTVARASQGGE